MDGVSLSHGRSARGRRPDTPPTLPTVFVVAVLMSGLSCGRRGPGIQTGLVRETDLPGRWLSRPHASAGDAQRDQRLGSCLGVEGVKVTKRVVGNDFHRETPTAREQVSSAATQWASSKMATAVRMAEN